MTRLALSGVRIRALLSLLLLCLAIGPAFAAEPSPALTKRAEQIVTLINGKGNPAEIFTPEFLTEVPAGQLASISKQMTDQFGPAKRVSRYDASSANNATLMLDFERAVVPTTLIIEPAAPNRVTGLFFSPGQIKGDTFAALVRDLSALPGATSLAVARLENGTVKFTTAHQADQALAVGSAFKLFILAELSREIGSGERKWSDVAHIDRRSVPSGILQAWPEGSPITLHSLAALMISQSDNTATDTLLHIIGRERVERLLPKLGIAAPAALRPLLATREAALLKAGELAPLGKDWSSATEAQRRKLIDSKLDGVTPDKVDLGRLFATPNAIDTVEWFASTADLVRTMDWLRVHAGKEALAILKINSGLAPPLTADFPYLGYKGGSEVGVMNMTFLIRSKSGKWHAVSGTWNDTAHGLDEAKFVQLMSRAVALLR
jgi:beta-lactamase class A